MFMAKVIQIGVGGFDNNFSYLVLGEKGHSTEGILIDPTGNLAAIDAGRMLTCIQAMTGRLHSVHVNIFFAAERIKNGNIYECGGTVPDFCSQKCEYESKHR